MKGSPLILAAAVAAACFADSNLKSIPLAQVRANPVALRSVDKDSEAYKGLVQSIKQVGVLNAITVREKTDPETKRPYYEIIDGLHRYTASLDAGADKDGKTIDTIDAKIMSLSDAAVLEAQIIGNIHTVETNVVEYTGQLIRILKQNPLMTEAELSMRLGKSPNWVTERLGLLKLIPEAQALVADGRITLSNAYALSKLDKEEQPNWLERAQTATPSEFTPAALARKKEMDKTKRAGNAPAEEKFIPTPHLQKLSDIKLEFENPTKIRELVKTHAGKDTVKAAQLALAWTLNMDPESLKVREDDFNSEKKRRAEEKVKRDAEKKEKRAVEAQKHAAQVTKEAEDLRAKAAATPA